MTIVSCPKCSDKVSVPAKAPPTARVRCPLCQEEYELGDALAQLPPMLIVVSGLPAEEPAIAAVGGMDAATGAEIGAAIGEHEFGTTLERGAAPVFAAVALDASPRSEGTVTAAPTPAFRSQPRPRRKEKSMVGELVKIVLGGVVGIVLAILILWWGPGVDLGLAPAVAKVKPMRFILPPSILKKADEANEAADRKEGTGNGGSGSDLNTTDSEPLNGSADESSQKKTGNKTESTSPDEGNADSGSKSSGKSLGGGHFGSPGKTASSKTKAATKSDDELTPAPELSEPKSSAKGLEVGDLNIGPPVLETKKAPEKKPQPAKTKSKEPEPTTEEPAAEEKPAKKPAESEKGTEPGKEKPAKPGEEKPADEKPASTEPEKEPAKKKEPEKPEPKKPAPPEETPKDPATPADLGQSIEAAGAAAKTFDGIDATDKEARKTAVVALYNAYAGLGRTIEQANLEDADNAEKLPALRQTLSQVANEPVKLNAIGTLAARRLDSEEGDPGILLAGIVKDFKAAGKLFETTIELVHDRRTVAVVSAKNPQDAYKVDDQILILGSIIRAPKEKLDGYQGEASIVVKAGHAMRLPRETKEE